VLAPEPHGLSQLRGVTVSVASDSMVAH
jgi:hypothetical protein